MDRLGNKRVTAKLYRLPVGFALIFKELDQLFHDNPEPRHRIRNVGYTLEPGRPQPFYASSIVAFCWRYRFMVADLIGLLLNRLDRFYGLDQI